MTKLFDKINDILDEAKMKIQKVIETDGVNLDRDQKWRDKIEAKINVSKKVRETAKDKIDHLFHNAYERALEELLEEK
jgi:hypothetical protein